MKHVLVGLLGFAIFILVWQLLKSATPIDIALAVAVGVGIAIADWITEKKDTP